jgi:hypothetical protein
MRSKKQLVVRVWGVLFDDALSTLHALLKPRVIGVDELARGGTTLGVCGA